MTKEREENSSLPRRLLGQVLVEDGQRRNDSEALAAGIRLLQAAAQAAPSPKATKTP